jgi:hypothetical protein
MSTAKMNTKTKTKTVPAVVDTSVTSTPVVSGGSNAASSLLLPSSSSASFTPLIPVERDLVSEFMALTPEQRLAIWDLIRPADESPVKPAKVPRTKVAAEPKPKKEKLAPAPLPDDGSVPTAAAYRLNPSDIDTSVCVGRLFSDEDKRWKPSVLRESQCGKAVVDGSDICSGCSKRSEKAAETGKHGAWNARVTEEPPSWCHMLGTAWAAKCKWNPDGGSVVSDSASVASDHSSTADKMNAAAAKKEAAAKKAEEKAAAAAKKAEEKTAAAAKKAEEKAAAATKKAEEAATKKASAKPKKEVAATSNAVADTTESVATAEGDIEIIGHNMYWVRNGNVYEYDQVSNAAGAFAGRKNPDGSIDEDADEEVDAESDSE